MPLPYFLSCHHNCDGGDPFPGKNTDIVPPCFHQVLSIVTGLSHQNTFLAAAQPGNRKEGKIRATLATYTADGAKPADRIERA